MRRSTTALLFAFAAALGAGTVAACSTGGDVNPTPPDPKDGGALPVDGAVPVVDAGTDAFVPTCEMTDIPLGTGTKFCELPGTDAPELHVPPEFCVREFTTTKLTEARVLRFAPNGDLFVAAPSQATPGGATDGPGSIIVLPDDDHDGKADSVLTYVGDSPRNGMSCATLENDPNNMSCVHGILFADGYLYFTRSDEVRRVAYNAGDRAIGSKASELVAKLGGAGISDVRWTHTLEQHKDGSILVSRGRSDTTECSPEEMTRGAVFALHVEVKPTLPLVPDLIADGFRNPMYLRCSPTSCDDCFASELTGDNWDGVGGREKVVLLQKGGVSWGFPCCVAPNIAAPGWSSQNCTFVGKELISIPLHDTPFGLDFDRGGFPEPYRHGLFVALHGVFTSFGGTGVVWLQTDPKSKRPIGEAKLFVSGFGKPNGRATDAVFAPDGRLFIADDTTGKIYWVAPRTLAAPK